MTIEELQAEINRVKAQSYDRIAQMENSQKVIKACEEGLKNDAKLITQYSTEIGELKKKEAEKPKVFAKKAKKVKV